MKDSDRDDLDQVGRHAKRGFQHTCIPPWELHEANGGLRVFLAPPVFENPVENRGGSDWEKNPYRSKEEVVVNVRCE